MWSGLVSLAAVLIALAISGCEPPTDDGVSESIALTDDATASPDRILRLVLRLTDDGIETIKALEAPGRIGRRDPYRHAPTFARGYDADGRLLFERGFRLDSELRSEVHGLDGTIEGARVPLGEPLFTVVVPQHRDLDRIGFYRAARGDPRSAAELIGEVRP
jgi:hypothetical protein